MPDPITVVFEWYPGDYVSLYTMHAIRYAGTAVEEVYKKSDETIILRAWRESFLDDSRIPLPDNAYVKVGAL